MQVFVHPDPVVLEAEVVARLRCLKNTDVVARALVVVPTARLGDQVRRQVVDNLEACLGVEVLHHRALTWRLLDQPGAPAPALATPRLLAALLSRALEKCQKNDWAQFVQQHPAARRGLLASLQDLREAGISAANATRILAGSRRQADLAEVYRNYEMMLQKRAAAGLVDEAGLVAAALPHAPNYARGFKLILHHGAYELTGVHLQLMRALDGAVPVQFLLPAAAGAPAYAHAEGFARRFLLVAGAEAEELPTPTNNSGPRVTSILGDRLRSLYREETRPQPLPPGVLDCAQAQGAATEVAAALRQGLADVDDGVATADIGFVARELSPYAATFETTCGAGGIPWTSSAGMPLRRQPRIHDLLRLLEILALDFPRAATASWLAALTLNWKAILPGSAPPPGDAADGWSREAGILGTLDEWTTDLTAWAADPRLYPGLDEDECQMRRARAEQRTEGATLLGQALTTLATMAATARPRTWSAHADTVARLKTATLQPPANDDATAADAQLEAILAEMRQMEHLAGESGEVSFGDMRHWIEEAVDATRLPAGNPLGAGLQVFDAMQARGHTFRRLYLLGMHTGLFPRRPREDPFLADEPRRQLRDDLGVPLAIKLEGAAEERLILALLLGSATETIRISWQRADENGRTRLPSLSLREVARVATGEPEMVGLTGAARRHHSNPLQFLEGLAASPGLLTAAEERLLLALRAPSPAAASRTLSARFPSLAAGLAMLEEIESLTPQGMRFDARVPGLTPPASLSVTSVGQLARCPLQYFFHRILRVHEQEEEASAQEITSRDMGIKIHTLLEHIYRQLDAAPAGAGGREKMALTLLDQDWPALAAAAGGRRALRLPFLWKVYLERWQKAVQSFIKEDLPRLQSGGWSIEALEQDRTRTLGVAAAKVEIHGRLDRLLRSGSRLLVGDYKTSGKLNDYVDIKNILRLVRLQVPLYWLLLEGGAGVELLGIGPDYAPGGRYEEHDRALFKGFDNDGQRQGFMESLETALSLLQRGSFPLNEGRPCDWCSFKSACRRQHPPTGSREENAPDTIDFRNLQKKTRAKPGLDDVREEPA